MRIIRYRHDRKLRVPVLNRCYSGHLPQAEEGTRMTVISFSAFEGKKADKEYVVNGCSRFLLKDIHHVALINVQNDSSLYAHLLWDITHQMPVGARLYIKEQIPCDSLLERRYYQRAFTEVEARDGFRVYLKQHPLTAEQDRGLEQWSFCIPTGPEDPTFLNACVERILQLNLPEFEIILCGTPHADFLFYDQVRIIGQEITAPPVHITRKKNALAQAARFPNLCIIHDRVMLPLNFSEAVLRFGDFYPMTGFQSFYFADQYNLIPRKYSDFNTIEQDLTRELNIRTVTKKDTALISKLFYCYQHPARSQFGHDYLTGSLYLCKKSVWLHSPQNEQLYWNDYEDIEQGIRCSDDGIPSIINPLTVTQSMNARSVIHYYGCVAVKDYRGRNRMSRSIMEILPFVRKKPLFRLSDEQARGRIYQFACKYGATRQVLQTISSSGMSGLARFLLIKNVIKEITVKLSRTSEFINDFSRLILCEEIAPNELIQILRVMNSSASPATKKSTLVGSFILNNQLSHSWFYSPFYRNNDDWFIKKTGNDSNLLIVIYCHVVPDDFVMQFN
ncbi:hypothetical protein JK211_14680 [Tatumella sp. JGM130]|uniref:hypothetical protein n=1 Tax=Tatumella sp. JGM130 TaxID=2799797 RepID=UPI001BB00E0E|nr:hypothetical protein [Tatumella sp. JGM130]MBS0895261.1 hypothetical protein [Tatumella sp. JGM130]